MYSSFSSILQATLDLTRFKCAEEKLAINRLKYPPDRVYGNAKKYDEY